MKIEELAKEINQLAKDRPGYDVVFSDTDSPYCFFDVNFLNSEIIVSLDFGSDDVYRLMDKFELWD